jgi:hypothetical protein
MQLVTRPWITASVALAGAGVVAVIPMSAHPPGLPDVQTRAVKLMSGSDPLTEWAGILQTAETDAADISEHWQAAPFADLQQEVANDVGYVDDLLKNPSDISTVFTDIQDNLNALFSTSLTDPGALWGPFLPDGGATDSLYQSLDDIIASTGTGLLGPGALYLTQENLFDQVQTLVPSLFTDTSAQQLVDSLLNLTASPESGILMGAIGTVLSPILEFNADVTAIGDALGGSTPDLTTAFQDLANMPADITNAFLNGFGDVNLMPLVDDLGITLPTLDVIGFPANITALDVDLGGLLSGGGSLFDAIGTGMNLDFPGLPTSFDLTGVAVGPLASMVELDQAIAVALGWSGVGDPLSSLADLGTSAPDAGSLATDLSTALTSLF